MTMKYVRGSGGAHFSTGKRGLSRERVGLPRATRRRHATGEEGEWRYQKKEGQTPGAWKCRKMSAIDNTSVEGGPSAENRDLWQLLWHAWVCYAV